MGRADEVYRFMRVGLHVRCLQGLFVIGWYVAGSVWVYGMNDMFHNCNDALYWFTFVLVLVGWCIVAASLLVLVLFPRSVLITRIGPDEGKERIIKC
jgi:hypothetical protein